MGVAVAAVVVLAYVCKIVFDAGRARGQVGVGGRGGVWQGRGVVFARSDGNNDFLP